MSKDLFLGKKNTTNLYKKLQTKHNFNNSSKDISFKKIGRNELCPCNSGKKYKHCHGSL